MNRHSTPYIIRVFLWLLIAVMMSPYLPMIQIVEAMALAKPEALERVGNPGGGLPSIREVGSVDTRYGLVAILVEEDLWERPLRQSIEQYAENVQNALPYTKSLILRVDSTEEDAADIQRSLEKLYFEGDIEDPDVTQLSGVVVIGEVPLPVVNKNGHRFISMIPYVDFEDPAYLLDGETEDFLPNANSTDLQPEVWHGVIVPPVDGEAGKAMLLDYFEKNNAFHQGDEVYASFDEKVFIGDYVREAEAVNKVAFQSYERFLDLWEELTYSQYSADLIESLYLEVMEGALSNGDGLDNDGDGRVDEEAANGIDDDGDGLTDEDNGDGLYNIDNDEDGRVDEDGTDDNNNDKNQFHSEIPEDLRNLFSDKMMDEDGPGDMNGDGCPGVCGVDDNGLASDADGDGYTTGWELLNGYDPYDSRVPRRYPERLVRRFDGERFASDEAALTWMENIFTDSFYGGQIQHPSCIDSDGVFHPEWDDDEDGFCDEDPGEGVVLANGCFANDADCDGREDEDPTGREPERLFDDVPDINIKPMVESMMSRYAEIFDQHMGVSNRIISQTGRYDVTEQDYDTAVSLIAKKDEYVLQYLGEVNDYFQDELTSIVKPNLAADIPMIAALQIEGTVTVEDEDAEDFCDDNNAADNDKACVQFTNFSYTGTGQKFATIQDSGRAERFFIYGQNIADIDHVGRCSIHAGTDGDGQLVEYNTLYSREAEDLSKSEVKDLNNCVPQNIAVKEDLPDVCNVNVATLPVRDPKGAIEPEKIPNNINTELLEVGFGACYEFRELATWKEYYDSYEKFGDWFHKKMRKFRKDEGDDDSSYREFLQMVREELREEKYDGMDNPTRKKFSELNILKDADGTYTVTNIFQDLGWDFSEGERADEIDIYIALNDSVTIRNPQYGRGVGDVERLNIRFKKAYIDAGGSRTTSSRSEAKKISSFLKHTQPWDDVLNKQIKNVGTPDLPIDLTHRMSFADKGTDAKVEILYPNMFDVDGMLGAEEQIAEIADDVAAVTGGARFEDDVLDMLYESEINLDQLEDALAWQSMSIDEKHRYMFTHYLGQYEPIMAKAREGYEIVSLIVDGGTDYVQFGFNGNAKDLTEEDWEFLHGSREAALSQLAGVEEEEEEEKNYGGDVEVKPVLIFEWVEEMKQWVGDLKTTMTSRNFTEGGLVCGDESLYVGPSYGEGASLPDGANGTVRIKLSGDSTALRPNQTEIVTVSARTSGGLVNSEDNFTEVRVLVVSGEDSIVVQTERIQMTNGVATFALQSLEPGNYVIQAETINRDDVGNVISNALEGEVLEQRLIVTSYVNEELTGVQQVDVEGELIEIEDGNGTVVAVFNPANGDLDLRGVEAELLQATEELPTRVSVRKEELKFGSLFMIPENKRVSIGNGLSGVFVNSLEAVAEAKVSDAGISLFVDGEEMGIVTELGQVVLSEGFELDFSDESYESENDLNLYAPLWVTDTEATPLFVIRNLHGSEDGNIVEPSQQESYQNYLSRLFPSASAEVVIPDTDGDLLDDLEEWAIGTDIEKADSDGDGVIDGTEVFSGTNPMANGPLFTDMGPEHPAYADVVRLYLRGVLSGYRDGSMKPDEEITREDFVKVNLGTVCKLCTQYDSRYEDQIFSEYNEDPFPDSDFTEETLACVADAKVNGIVDGYQGGENDGFFLPQENISWAEAIKVVVNTAEMELIPVAESLPWYATYVQTAYANRLLPNDFSSEFLSQAITRAEFAQMAMRSIEANDCRLIDTDGEGLSDAEETYIYGTDPLLIDTDRGGVDDFTEITRGSDALDGRDDFSFDPDNIVVESEFEFENAFDHEAGVYVISDDAAYEVVTVNLEDNTELVKVFVDELPADGQSSLVVQAELRDGNNRLMSEDNLSTVEFVLSSAEHGEVASRRVQMSAGVAETSFNSSVISGDVEITAQLVDGSAAVDVTGVDVYAGDPVRLAITAESSVLPAGGESVTDMLVTLYDTFGNVSDHGFYTLTLDTEGGLEILDINDLDDEMEGIQVSTPTGELAFRVLAGPDEALGAVMASLTDVEGSEDRFSIQMMDGLQLEAEFTAPILFVDSGQPQGVEVQLVDRGGQVVSGFNGRVNLSLNDPAYGSLEETSIQLNSGIGRTLIYPGTLAGTGYLLSETVGIESGSASFTLKPGDVSRLEVRQEDNLTELAADEIHFFVVEAYDAYNNLVTTDSATTVNLRLTDATNEYGSLSSRSLTLNQGMADFNLRTKNVSGKLNLIASSPSVSESATWSGDVFYQMDSAEFSRIAPQMLYGSVLGGSYGKVTQEDYLGGFLTFNGKTQALTTLIDEPVARLPRVGIDARGSVSLPDGGFVTQVVQGAGRDLPVRMQWRGLPDDELMAEVTYVMPRSSEVASGVTVQDISTRGDLEIEEKNGEILVREDQAVIMKVRQDGQIVLLSESYNLAVMQNAESLQFAVTRLNEPVLLVDTNSPWNSAVTVLDAEDTWTGWRLWDAGIYILPSRKVVPQLKEIPTGNSTSNPHGYAILDEIRELPENQQPSLGYTSLEGALDNGDIGWEGDSKHMMLFAAGNTAGQSNLFYPSEIGVLLGDPTIKLTTRNETNTLGYTSDLGTMVSASNDSILELMDIDYNGDGTKDVLAAYADGRIELLQNTNSPNRLQNVGDLLYVENGIKSIDKGDFNGDGLDDILVVTETSCLEGEMCLYLYENIGGGFVAQNLSFSEIEGKPVQVVTADLNNDDYTDLTIVDENMVAYAVWNVEGRLEVVEEIENFGLKANPSENLRYDVLIRTASTTSGSASIPMRTTNTSSETLGTDINEFIQAISQNADITVDLGESGGQTTRVEDIPFEKADAESMMEQFATVKSHSDVNGGRLEVGDTVRVTLTTRNIAGNGAVSGVFLSDTVGAFYEDVADSFACVQCSEFNQLSAGLMDGDRANPWVFGPLYLEDGEAVTVTYNMVVKSLPEVQIMPGQDIYNDYVDDSYLDLAVTLEGNNSGDLLVYYSDGTAEEVVEEGGVLGIGERSFTRVNYRRKKYGPDTHPEEYDKKNIPNPFADEDENGIPDFVDGIGKKGIPVAPAGTFDVAKEIMGARDKNGNGYYGPKEMYQSDLDADNDGLLDSIDPFVNSGNMFLDPSFDLNPDDVILSDEEFTGEGSVDTTTLTAELNAELNLFNEEVDAIADGVEKVVDALTCNGGCLAFMPSMAFMSPFTLTNPINGLPMGVDPYPYPVLGFGVPPVSPIICTGPTCAFSSFRIYMSPSTTLGLGMGLCAGGPMFTGACMAYNVPLLQSFGVCDAINGAVTDVLSKVSEYTSFEATISFKADGNTQASLGGAEGLSSDLFTDYEAPVQKNVNIQVPGFPSIFTEWWKGQKHEFFKMLDLPDVTFIYPEWKSITNELSYGKTGERYEENKANSTVELTTLEWEGKMSQTRAVLNAGIMGLENMLNWAHSLPLLDIKTEDVVFKFPWLTPEEIELIKRDGQEWIDDTETELDRFLAQFCLGDERRDDNEEQGCVAEVATEELAEAIAEIEEVVNDLIAGVEQNLAVIESYARIPEQILQIRTLGAYYIKIIICYIDAILSFTAGYLLENTERIIGWIKFVMDLTTIIKGWEILLQLALDLIGSCDQCTNQRWSGIHILLSLFIFIPDLPVIQMPKLPDIVIDVSQIQAGLDIVWPNIKFVPEPINVPELPRIKLPGVNFNLDLDLNVEIPVLPEFDLLFELPPLPGLTLPNLPNLPPPPKVPELLPTIQAALNIASNIIRIICVIRMGLIPVPEFALKQKIEDITQRPGGIVLPLDLKITVEWPEFSLDFLERIDVKTYVNLTFETPILYDLLNDMAERSNEAVGNVDDVIEEAMQAVADQLQDLVDLSEYQLELDASVEGDADFNDPESSDFGGEAEGGLTNGDSAYLNIESIDLPAVDVALQYKDHPLVVSQLEAFNVAWKNLDTQIDEWSVTVPDDIQLVATERVLALDDPLLNRYDDIIENHRHLDTEFLARIEDSPLSDLADIRENMIAYVEDLEYGTERLQDLEGSSFLAYLADEYAASGDANPIVLAGQENTGGFSMSAQWNPERAAEATREETARLIADSTASDASSTDGLEVQSQAEYQNVGIFILNEEEGVAERLVDYTAEVEEATSILFVDLDDDGDEDVVYSMGGDIYVKTNYSVRQRSVHVSSDPSVADLEDYKAESATVHNLVNHDNSHQETSFNFTGVDEAVAYDVSLYDSIDASQVAPEDNVKRLLLVNQDELPAEQIGESSYASSPARVYVNNTRGRVSLMNGVKRTLLSQNAEIKTDDPLKIQTLEDAVITVSNSRGSERLEVSAYQLISLPAGTEQVVRMERGTAVWIQESEVLEEQELIEGSMLFIGEQIMLENRLAVVNLSLAEGATMRLDKQELFSMDRLLNPSNPAASIGIENGAYYSVAHPLLANGGRGTRSAHVLLNPQICGDESAPFALIDEGNSDGSGANRDLDGDGTIDLPIYDTAALSAANSFDSGSEILEATWDFDAEVDSDGNGIPNDDVQFIGLDAEIGPYDSIGLREVTVWVKDLAGNTGSATIDVNVFVPSIYLSSANETRVIGGTDLASPSFPYDLVRERNGAVETLRDDVLTNESGGIDLRDFEASELLSVYNHEGDTVAQFNPQTKQAVAMQDGYSIGALPSDGVWPSRLIVFEEATAQILASFIVVSNEDLVINTVGFELGRLNLQQQAGITLHFHGDEESYTETEQGLFAYDAFGNPELSLTRDGNLRFYDEGYEVKRRAADSLEEELVLEIYDEGVLEFEYWPGNPQDVTITDAAELGLPDSNSLADVDGFESSADFGFVDILESDALYEDILEMVENQILQGYLEDDGRYFRPNQKIQRSEFTKIILSILCIEPRAEAFALPSVFNDVESLELWYYSWTKEANLLGLIQGYLGETNDEGFAPFKPAEDITRAEAAKIVVEALEMQDIIEIEEGRLSDFDGPWYTPYIDLALENGVITPAEALKPNEELTRYDFVEIAARVLELSNCFEKAATESDFDASSPLQLEPGVYAVRESCYACPCEASIDYESELRPGDTVFAIIRNSSGEIFGISNKLSIE